MATTSYDAIVIGAGHNGLVCAATLARKRRKVLVLEADAEPGGAARTVEFAPGHRVSHVAHILSHLNSEVVEALALEKNGLRFAATELPTVALDVDGRHLVLRGAFGESIEGDISGPDLEAWQRLRARLLAFAALFQPWLLRIPPTIGNYRDLVALGSLGLAARRLGRQEARHFMRMITMSIADVLDEEIADQRLKGAIAFDAVLGTALGPRSPGTVMSLLYRLAGGSGGRQGAVALPEGGMGTVADALVAALAGLKGELRTNSTVERILIEDGRATGVVLAGGDEVRAETIVSAVNPRTTFRDLVGAERLDTGFAGRIGRIPMRGNAAKFHAAMTRLPKFTALADELAGGRLVVAPSVDYVEWAFNPSKYGRFSDAPVLEIVVPTVSDTTLAPPGNHVLSAVVQYAPSDLGGGWDFSRTSFEDIITETLESYAPGVGATVFATELLTPDDLEARYRMPGGHWHHGALSFDRILMFRPLPDVARYGTPVPGLYLCGAGCHPGGGVMGAAGYNAARKILAERRKR